MKRLKKRLHATSALTPALLLAATVYAAANPLDGKVVSGDATITAPDPQTLSVTQTTDRAIINWREFNIEAGETTRFVQPGSESWTLNRVTGSNDPSRILGNLEANGNVIIVNPDGIHFGAGAQVDVNRLIATTSGISNENFNTGNLIFDQAGNASASIVIEAGISVKDYGLAAFVAPSVRNSGTITARLGTINLASGNSFTIDPYGDGLVKLAIDDEISAEVFDVATGKPVSDLVKNEGTLKADGGTVAMSAATARLAVNSVINNTGVIEANTVRMRGGKIILGAQTRSTKVAGAPQQVVRLSGPLSATTYEPITKVVLPKRRPEEKGQIVVTGEVILGTSATINVSGNDGGGAVLIGGDYLGGNATPETMAEYGIAYSAFPVPTADFVVLEESVTITADATDNGDGGKVVVWSNEATLTSATITARGGSNGGDGGFIETSGKNYLSVLTAADASASNGKVGSWLMDPVNIRIVDGLEQYLDIMPNQFWGQFPVNGTLVDVFADFYVPVDQYNLVPDGFGGFTRIDSHSSASIIDAATIETALNSGTAVFITNVNSLGDDAGWISIEADINKTSGGDGILGFNSVDDIVIASGVDITSTSGRLLLSFASAEGQIRGNNTGFVDTNGGLVLLAAKEGANISAAGFGSDVGNPSAIQIDIQNYPSSSGSYELSSAGGGFVNFSYNAATATFGQNSINLGGTPISLQLIMDHNAVLADGAITDTSQSQIVFLFIDPASTLTATQPGNNVAEINSNGLVAAGSQAGVGGELNVLPLLEVAESMNPVTQCAGITCVPVTPVVVPPVPPVVSDPELLLGTAQSTPPFLEDAVPIVIRTPGYDSYGNKIDLWSGRLSNTNAASALLTYANLANGIYDNAKSIDGWNLQKSWKDILRDGFAAQGIVEKAQLEIVMLTLSASGFNAAIYEKNGEIALVFEGSATLFSGVPIVSFMADYVGTNLPQLIFGDRDLNQYDFALIFANFAQAEYSGKQLTTVGHSLGGGLAQYVASENSQIKSVTFNAAGLGPSKGVAPSNLSNVINVRLAGDPVSAVRNQIGSTKYTFSTSKINKHSIKNIINSLEENLNNNNGSW
uniref:two-partner secretion domain-containing protein n=1 Tax=Pararhizobium sp. IMCC3301 TaxID=3067904 RepID=UPI0027407E19|nr:filamentous hemagglutinin N-terminal domain-containing protein [Pararhizobium sp. IMCC3301]